jgi:2-keto-4-pentenoate hydratase/2-oxohepta-3-ene-1,7-dioic acid hydratase in catechol pathway
MVARVNGKVVGEGNGSGARFNFAEMISFASEGTTLPAGTILCSGPIEVGSCLKHGTFLQPGDQVELEVAGIGTLRNKVWERPLPRIFSPKG